MKTYVISIFVTKDYISNFIFWLEFYEKIRRYPLMIHCPDENTKKALKPFLKPEDKVIILSWGKGRNKVWIKRIESTLELLERYDSVINTDLDAYWFSPQIYEVIEQNNEYDILSSLAPDGFPAKQHRLKWESTLCCGFQIFKSTSNTKDFLRKMLKKDIQKISFKIWKRYSDQGILNYMLHKMDHKIKKSKSPYITYEINSPSLEVGCLTQKAVKRYLISDWINKKNNLYYVVHILEKRFKRKDYSREEIKKIVKKLYYTCQRKF